MYIIDFFKKNFSLIVSLLLYFAFITLLHIGCPILSVTGIPCPGCGMTRALINLLKLNFSQAFSYHPLCFFMPVFAVIIISEKKINKRLFNICIGIIIALFVLVYLTRLFNPDDALIKIRISNGLIYKLLIKFKERGIFT